MKDGSAAAFVADRPEASSLIFDIVRLEASHPDNGEAALARIVIGNITGIIKYLYKLVLVEKAF